MRKQHAFRNLPSNQHIRAVGALLFGSLACVQVAAQALQTVKSPALDSIKVTSVGSVKTVGFGFGEAANTPKMVTGSPVGNMGAFVDPSGNKGLEIKGTAKLPIGTAGRVVEAAVVGKVTSANLTKSLVALSALVGGWPGVLLLGGIGIAQWLQDSKVGFVVGNLPGGGQWIKENSGDGYEYALSAAGPWFGTKIGPVDFAFPGCSNNVVNPAAWYRAPPPGSPANYNGPCVHAQGILEKRVQTVVYTSVITEAQAMAELQARQANPWVLSELYNNNAPVDVTNVLARFPTGETQKIIEGPTSTITTPAQNGQPAKTIVERTDYNCVFVVADVTCTDKKTTTSTFAQLDPVTGLPVEITETKTEQKEAEPTKGEDPCIANPKRNGCREDEFDTPTGEVPKTTKTITFASENLGFGGGTCPADKFINVHGMSSSLKVWDWQSTCSKVTTYAKPMILALATFAALMIIFAGGSKTE